MPGKQDIWAAESIFKDKKAGKEDLDKCIKELVELEMIGVKDMTLLILLKNKSLLTDEDVQNYENKWKVMSGEKVEESAAKDTEVKSEQGPTLESELLGGSDQTEVKEEKSEATPEPQFNFSSSPHQITTRLASVQWGSCKSCKSCKP